MEAQLVSGENCPYRDLRTSHLSDRIQSAFLAVDENHDCAHSKVLVAAPANRLDRGPARGHNIIDHRNHRPVRYRPLDPLSEAVRFRLLANGEGVQASTVARREGSDRNGDRVGAHGEAPDRLHTRGDRFAYDSADELHRVAAHRRRPAVDVERALLARRELEATGGIGLVGVCDQQIKQPLPHTDPPPSDPNVLGNFALRPASRRRRVLNKSRFVNINLPCQRNRR